MLNLGTQLVTLRSGVALPKNTNSQPSRSLRLSTFSLWAIYEVSLRYLSGFAPCPFPININISVLPDPLLGPINPSDANGHISGSYMQLLTDI